MTTTSFTTCFYSKRNAEHLLERLKDALPATSFRLKTDRLTGLHRVNSVGTLDAEDRAAIDSILVP